jgi:hypothetical protein
MSSTSPNRWPLVIFLGTLWGVSECLLGIYLRQCASLTSGSIMTAVAIFFLTAGWTLSRTRLAIPAMVILASLFKMADALLLSLPFRHGAVANPIFAFFMEGLALWLIITFSSETWQKKIIGQAMAGVFTALTAVNLFPLVKYATGIPACVYPGTNYPLSLYYAPLAVALSALSYPAGRAVGQSLAALEGKAWSPLASPWIRRLVAPASLVAGLALLVVWHGWPKL